MDSKGIAKQYALDRADEDKVIPWAEGNGLWAALNRLVSDLIGADLVGFFADNPYASDSADSLAVRIGRLPAEVQPVLESLIEAGVLEVVDLGGLHIYQLAEDPHIRQTVQQYVTWLREGYHWARMVLDR